LYEEPFVDTRRFTDIIFKAGAGSGGQHDRKQQLSLNISFLKIPRLKLRFCAINERRGNLLEKKVRVYLGVVQSFGNSIVKGDSSS